MIETIRERYLGRLVGAVGGVLLLVYMLSPQQSAIGAGVDPGQILTELLPAAFLGVTALSLVLIYRTVRIINFAQIAFGVVGQLLFFEFYTRNILPYPIAWLVAILGGTIITMVVGVIASTLFFRHPRLTMTVVTVFLTSVINFAANEISAAFTQPGENRGIVNIPIEGSFWHSTAFQVGIVPIRVAHLIGFGAVALVLLGLFVFFRRTRFGIAVRASAENADRASLLGINVKFVQFAVWSIVGLITTVVALAQMPVVTYVPGAMTSFEGLLPALAAAVLVRFNSLPGAFLVGVGIHYLRLGLTADLSHSTAMNIILFVAILAGLLLQRQRFTRVDDSSSWKAVREVRPTPAELLQIGAIRFTRRIFSILALVLVVAAPFLVTEETARDLGFGWIIAIVLASLVILTGWTGQISLGHTALIGAGAIIAANATATWDLPFLVALPLGGLMGALIAFLVGLPALRIRGLFLAVATFALAAAFPVLFLIDRYLASWIPAEVPIASFGFGLTFEDPKVVYFTEFILFLLVFFAVKRLRASRAGRLLIALRDNEQGVQSFGVDIVRTRLMAFAISGFIAGLAGAVLVHAEFGIVPSRFFADTGFLLFQLAIIGGVSTLAGAVLGGMLFSIGTLVIPGIFALLTSVGGLVLMMGIPGGLSQVFFGMRDAVLRVVALRKHLVVPSLFADYSPEAWEKRLTPLAPAVPSQGIGALPADQRYTLESRLYGKASA